MNNTARKSENLKTAAPGVVRSSEAERHARSAPAVAPDKRDVERSGRGSTVAAWRQTFAASRLLQVLGVVLLAQLVLAGGLYWNAGRDSDFSPAGHLVAFDETAADRIEIETEESQLVLTRVESGWQLQGDDALPADSEKVEKLLAQLSALKGSLPVATTRGAREQLEVAEDSFQRHITVQQGGEVLTELYIGTSPGYQRAHVRRAGDDAIIAARLNVYDVPEDRNGWMDRRLLSFEDVSRIQTDDFTLAREDEQWRIEAPESMQEGHEVAQASLDKLLDTLHGLRVTGLADASEGQALSGVTTETESADVADAEPQEAVDVLAWSITDAGGEPVTLSVSKQGSEVIVTRSDWPQAFTGTVSVFNTLNGVDLAELLPEKITVGAGPAESATEEALNESGKAGAPDDNASSVE